MNTPIAVAIVIAVAMIWFAWLFSYGGFSLNRFFAEAVFEQWIKVLAAGAFIAVASWLWKKWKSSQIRLPTGVFRSTQSAEVIKKHKWVVFVVVVILGAFYWYEWRPTAIRKNCLEEVGRDSRCERFFSEPCERMFKSCLLKHGITK